MYRTWYPGAGSGEISNTKQKNMNTGIFFALGAYLLWGLFPIYWKWLHHVSALQLVGHRIGWSFIFLIIVIVFTKRWTKFRSSLTRKVLAVYAASGLLLSVNWLIYVWGVNAGYIVETSLGYFINPLLSVLLGVIFLRERLRPLQWLPIGLAAAGVIHLTFAYGSLPWIALSLAFSFGTYGLVKKLAPLGSLYGLTLETGAVFVPAVTYLLMLDFQGRGSFLHTDFVTHLLLVGSGLVTAVPLLLFASAVQRIPLSMVGVMQYITPTMQFLISVLVYKEAFTSTRLIGFSLVWAALIIFWLEGFFANRVKKKPIGTV